MWFLLAGDWDAEGHAWPSPEGLCDFRWGLQAGPPISSDISKMRSVNWDGLGVFFFLHPWAGDWSPSSPWRGTRDAVIQHWLPPEYLRCPWLQHLRRRYIVLRVCFVFWLWWRRGCSEMWWIPHSWQFSSCRPPTTWKQGKQGAIDSCQQLCLHKQQLLGVPKISQIP